MSGTILTLDSSGRTAGLCILRGGAVLYQRYPDAGRTHSETLLPLVDECLAAAGLTLADIDLLAVTAGPGSFTGLRIGMALVKGLALPAGIPAVGVSTLEAAAVAAARALLPAGWEGLIVPALDARRGEVYWAGFEADPAAPLGLRRLAEDRAGPAAEVAATLPLGGRAVFYVGDGAEICYNVSKCDPGANGTMQAKPPTAMGAALLALEGRGQAVPAAALRPSYLRRSQAERQRLKAEAAHNCEEAAK